jgi:hypothetical protein
LSNPVLPQDGGRSRHFLLRYFNRARDIPLIVTGVGTTLYLLTVVAETLLEGHLLSPNPRKRRKLDRPDQVHSWGFLLG